MTIHWTAELGLRTITGRTFQADNVFHRLVARVHIEIMFLLLVRTDPDNPSDSLRERLADALSAVIAFWRDCGRLWFNKSFLESLETTEGIDDDTRWLCVVAACLLCLDRALAHGDRGHAWEADDWFDCAKWLHVVLFTWGEAKIFQMILTIPEQQEVKARAQTRNAGKQRWVKRDEAKEKVRRDLEKELEKDPSRFASAAKAGVYYSDWLAKRKYQFEPDTVEEWIRGFGIPLKKPVKR